MGPSCHGACVTASTSWTPYTDCSNADQLCQLSVIPVAKAAAFFFVGNQASGCSADAVRRREHATILHETTELVGAAPLTTGRACFQSQSQRLEVHRPKSPRGRGFGGLPRKERLGMGA